MKYLKYSGLIFLLLAELGCKKFLDEKPDQQLVVPTKTEDLQAILDDYYHVNQSDPSAGERSADNYYLTDTDWMAISDEQQRRVYTWEKDNLFHTTGRTEWSYSYDNVYRANIVQEGLNKIKEKEYNKSKWNTAYGHALFIRAKSFLQIATIWAQAYNAKTATDDLGIPLRTDPNYNNVSIRSSLYETYQQIIEDLKRAIPLLPVKAIHLLRPSRPAAEALLARTYLSMGDYNNALLYADSSLRLKSTILDYNTIDTLSDWTFSPQFSNPEILIAMFTSKPGTLLYNKAKIDSILYKSYEKNDLRKTVYFSHNEDSTIFFRGSYTGRANIFSGIATDEVYLIKAECLARLNRIKEALNTLNSLLVTRWKTGTFIPFKAKNKEKALKTILNERRKELLMRGLRWMDIKRLNVKGANIVLKRIINGKIYILQPNDLRYALPIPEDVIKMTGMIQNPR